MCIKTNQTSKILFNLKWKKKKKTRMKIEYFQLWLFLSNKSYLTVYLS